MHKTTKAAAICSRRALRRTALFLRSRVPHASAYNGRSL